MFVCHIHVYISNSKKKKKKKLLKLGSNEELKPWIHEQSKKFCETYFQDTENLLTTTAISKLLEISKSLKEKNFTQPQAFSILEELATILCEGSEGVSAFQLLNGQIVDG